MVLGMHNFTPVSMGKSGCLQPSSQSSCVQTGRRWSVWRRGVQSATETLCHLVQALCWGNTLAAAVHWCARLGSFHGPTCLRTKHC